MSHINLSIPSPEAIAVLRLLREHHNVLIVGPPCKWEEPIARGVEILVQSETYKWSWILAAWTRRFPPSAERGYGKLAAEP